MTAAVSLHALPGIPAVQQGDDLAALIRDGLARAGLRLQPYDVLVLAQKIVSKAEGPQQPAGELSGGNLQKLLLARELSRLPSVLVVQQPTQGLDIGASEDVWKSLLEAREHAGVLLVTGDLTEALTLSDRVAVIFAGNILGVADVSDPDQVARISPMMAGVRQ